MLSNCLLNISVYNHKKTLVRKAAFLQQWMQRFTAGQGAENKWVFSVPRISVSPPSRLRNIWKECKGQMIGRRIVTHYCLGMMRPVQSGSHGNCSCLHWACRGLGLSLGEDLMEPSPSLRNHAHWQFLRERSHCLQRCSHWLVSSSCSCG